MVGRWIGSSVGIIKMLRGMTPLWSEKVSEARARLSSFANKGWSPVTRENTNECLPWVGPCDVDNVSLVACIDVSSWTVD